MPLDANTRTLQLQSAARLLHRAAADFSRAIAFPAAAPLLEQYRPVRKLGEGAFGEVWLLQSLAESNELIAAKVLKRDLSDADRSILEREVRNLVRATALHCHPNVVCYRGHSLRSIARGQPPQDVVLFQFVDGIDLFDHITKNLQYKRPKPAEALRVVKGLVDGLEFLHRGNVAHRDIKAENVMLDMDASSNGDKVVRRPVLIDLGLSCFMDDQCQHRVGTKVYWPPEILDRDPAQPLTLAEWKKADVYMLGALLYEYLSGTILRKEFARMAAANEIDWCNLYPPMPQLAHMIARMVDPDAKRRPNVQQVSAYAHQLTAQT